MQCKYKGCNWAILISMKVLRSPINLTETSLLSRNDCLMAAQKQFAMQIRDLDALSDADERWLVGVLVRTRSQASQKNQKKTHPFSWIERYVQRS